MIRKIQSLERGDGHKNELSLAYDVIVVGGGPAGLTAAVYALRKQLKVLLLSEDLGGKTNLGMQSPTGETHHSVRGVELIERFWRELEALDYVYKPEKVVKIERQREGFVVETERGMRYETTTVILATGSRLQRLNVPGEAEYAGYGLSYSAISFAPRFNKKRVAVIGDAKLAMQSVLELALVAQTVYLIVPAPTRDVAETPQLQGLAEELKVIIWEGYVVKAIRGEAFAKQVVLETPGGEEIAIDVDGIFVELGLLPNSELVADFAEIDNNGFVMVDNVNRTSYPGLFAAGDVTNAYAEQVLIAVGEGAKAALSAYNYLFGI